MTILTIVIVLVVILIVTSLTLLYMKRSSQSTTLYNLSDSLTQALPNNSLPWNMTTPSSLRFAVYINTAPKTVSNINCTDTTDTTKLRQSCTDYSFTSCTCRSANDCTNCSTDSYLNSLVSLGGFVNLWVSGYLAQSDKPFVSTVLAIKTASNNASHIETISLPAIPLQKWTVITIAQEGRRIDIYYGADSVASTYLKHAPIPANATNSWMVGGMDGWVGRIGLFSSRLVHTTSDDVANDVAQLVDSTGLPYSQNEMDFSFDLDLPSCILGTCPGLPAVHPPNPFSVYATSVS
jgi:hypothetical protein